MYQLLESHQKRFVKLVFFYVFYIKTQWHNFNFPTLWWLPIHTHSGQKLSQQHLTHTTGYKRASFFVGQHFSIAIYALAFHLCTNHPQLAVFPSIRSSSSIVALLLPDAAHEHTQTRMCIIAICGIRGIRVPRSEASAVCNLHMYNVCMLCLCPGELNTKPSPTAGHGDSTICRMRAAGWGSAYTERMSSLCITCRVGS